MDEPTWWQKLLQLEPAMVTGLIVSIFGLIGAVLGITIAPEVVQNVVTVILGISALLATVLLRGKVTANAKVVVYDDTPLAPVATLKAGEAVVTESNDELIAVAARRAA